MSSEDTFDAWWRDGTCAQIGPDLFFVSRGESIGDALAACRGCPVREKCLTDSLKSDIEYGVFGGFARPMRRIMRIQVENGRDPADVARQAIHEENTKRRRFQWTR